MANTYTAIATVTVGSGGAANIEFTSIPATYTDLLVKISSRMSGTPARSVAITLSLNGSSSSFTARHLYGSGSVAGSYTGTTAIADSDAANATSNTFGSQEIYIPNYAGSTYKSFSVDGVQEDNQTEAYVQLIAGLWSNTSAINSITFTSGGGNFVQYTTATLYGIKNS